MAERLAECYSSLRSVFPHLRVELNVRWSGTELQSPSEKILYREFMSDTDDIFVWNRSPSRKWKIPNEICATAGGLLIRRVSAPGIYAKPESPGAGWQKNSVTATRSDVPGRTILLHSQYQLIFDLIYTCTLFLNNSITATRPCFALLHGARCFVAILVNIKHLTTSTILILLLL